MPGKKSMGELVIELIAKTEDEGKRLDKFLSEDARLGSRTIAAWLISNNKVLVNRKSRSKNFKLKDGDIIEFNPPPPKIYDLKPQKIEFKVMYEDDCLAVISKPPGLVVHPSHGHHDGTLIHGLLAHFKDLSTIDLERPGIVHRLDKDTSGLMIITKKDDIHRAIAEALKNREIKRHYLALVAGDIKENGTIDVPVGRHPVNRKKMAVLPTGKKAVTNFDVTKRYGNATLLNVKLDTGRTHQIRVHMSYIGHPVVGDPLYGGKGKVSKLLGLERQFLHSFRIEFKHPVTGQEMAFEELLPPDLEKALNILEPWQGPTLPG